MRCLGSCRACGSTTNSGILLALASPPTRTRGAGRTAHPEALLRGLIHSDGCRSLNPVGERAYPRYLFSNRSEDIRDIFCEHLDLLGIPWRQMNRWNISVARREAVARLDEFVGAKR